MPTIFISHSSADREFVERHLVPFLNGHGLRTWYAKEQIRSGKHWERSIQEGLQSADWFLVVVSQNALGSEWVRAEVDWAVENRWERLVPVLIEDARVSDLHLRLRLVQHFDWRNINSVDKRPLLSQWKIDLERENDQPGKSETVKFDDYLYARPANWFCVFCGWKCNEKFNDYICKRCGKIRPFAGGSATMIECRLCQGFSLGVASYCEWCGHSFYAV